MGIKNVKISMLKYGVTSLKNPKRKVLYLPVAEITYLEKKKAKKSINLSGLTENKQYHKGLIIGMNYFVIHVNEEYHIYNEDGTQTKILKTSAVGAPVYIAADFFICRQENKYSYINAESEIVMEKEMSEEEWQAQFEKAEVF